jgi:hypothetical protein
MSYLAVALISLLLAAYDGGSATRHVHALVMLRSILAPCFVLTAQRIPGARFFVRRRRRLRHRLPSLPLERTPPTAAHESPIDATLAL